MHASFPTKSIRGCPRPIFHPRSDVFCLCVAFAVRMSYSKVILLLSSLLFSPPFSRCIVNPSNGFVIALSAEKGVLWLFTFHIKLFAPKLHRGSHSMMRAT